MSLLTKARTRNRGEASFWAFLLVYSEIVTLSSRDEWIVFER